jgi:hypothetical protein
MQRLKLLALTTLVPACLAGDNPETCVGKCDTPVDSCADVRYGDGQCNLDLECKTPDIDCFVTFESDADATEWFARFEEVLAEEELREPRPLLPQSDPRYAAMRELLDEGWESYRAHRNVGDLGDSRVALVLVDDPAVNAFVAPDLDLSRAGLAVMVQTGLIEAGGSPEAMFGLVMHELEHAIGLHVIPEVKDGFRRFYQVQPGAPEPFGFEQSTDPIAAEALLALFVIGQEVGLQPLPELNGLPLRPGMFADTVRFAHQSGVENDPASCGDADAGLELLVEFVGAHTDTLAGALVPGSDADSLDFLTSEFLAALRDPCLAGSTASLFDVLAAQLGASAADIRAATSPEDMALVDGEHLVDAIVAITLDRYAKIDAIDDTLDRETGGGIESLRYYTAEEAADDSTVAVLRNAGAPPDGLASFMLGMLTPADRAECEAMIASGEVPPYGVDLVDDHHGTCWRAWHIRELAARPDGAAGTPLLRQTPRPPLADRIRALAPSSSWPRPIRLGDTIPDCLVR